MPTVCRFESWSRFRNCLSSTTTRSAITCPGKWILLGRMDPIHHVYAMSILLVGTAGRRRKRDHDKSVFVIWAHENLWLIRRPCVGILMRHTDPRLGIKCSTQTARSYLSFLQTNHCYMLTIKAARENWHQRKRLRIPQNQRNVCQVRWPVLLYQRRKAKAFQVKISMDATVNGRNPAPVDK